MMIHITLEDWLVFLGLAVSGVAFLLMFGHEA